ncbi:type IV pilin protein [Alkalibacterium sp. s-m-28]
MQVEMNKMLKLNMIREKGFTIVELLAVLVILSIIPSISFPH